MGWYNIHCIPSAWAHSSFPDNSCAKMRFLWQVMCQNMVAGVFWLTSCRRCVTVITQASFNNTVSVGYHDLMTSASSTWSQASKNVAVSQNDVALGTSCML